MSDADEKILLPSWFQEDFLTTYNSALGRVFILHGDITSLVVNPDSLDEPDRPYVPMRRFLEKILSDHRLVIFYSIAAGLQFANPDAERFFKKIVGLEDDGAPTDPVAAAKAGLKAKRGLPKDPDSVLPLLDLALRNEKRVAVVINSVHFLAPVSGGSAGLPPNERVSVERLKNLGQSATIRKKDNLLLLMTEEAAKISPELRHSSSGINQIFVPKPSKPERLAFIKSLAADGKRYPLPKDFDPEVFAHETQGMSFRQILDMFVMAAGAGEPISLKYVKGKKREILNTEYGDVMEVVEPKKGLEDIGGLDYAKNFLRDVLEAIKKGEERLVSMGITLMGPPGTGKTALVEALAKEAGFNFVKIKNVRSMWVGESEARMQKLVYGLRSLAPVVVMNDEADLMDANRDAPRGDSGVSERLMKMWMELLSDPKIRGQIIVISCTNRPDRLDAALKRSGRADERILIPMPSVLEIPDIFRVMFKRYNIETKISDFRPHAELTKGLSGADIEKLVLSAFRFAFERSQKSVSDKVLKEAINDFIPSASQTEIDRMTMLGLLECSSRRLLPPNVKEILKGVKSRNLVEGLDAMLVQIKARKIVEF